MTFEEYALNENYGVVVYDNDINIIATYDGKDSIPEELMDYEVLDVVIIDPYETGEEYEIPCKFGVNLDIDPEEWNQLKIELAGLDWEVERMEIVKE